MVRNQLKKSKHNLENSNKYEICMKLAIFTIKKKFYLLKKMSLYTFSSITTSVNDNN